MTSFKGALTLAIVSLCSLAMSLSVGSEFVWLDAFFVVFWCFMAKRALNKQSQPSEIEVTLTREQKDRIREASQALNTVIREVEDECMAEATAMRLKARREKDKTKEDEDEV
jgi:Spy/CpxP family protein refolding chaperone